MTELDTTWVIEKAEEDAQAAASWLLDGNSSFADAYRIFRGIADGDTEVIDSLTRGKPPLNNEPRRVSELLELVPGVDMDSDTAVIDDVLDEYFDAFHDELAIAATDEALERMDQHLGDKLSFQDEVYYRGANNFPWDAEKMTVGEVFERVQKDLTYFGGSTGRAGTINVDAYEDGSVPEYPDYTIETSCTSRGQIIIWLETT